MTIACDHYIIKPFWRSPVLFPQEKEKRFPKKDVGFLLLRGFSVMIACDHYYTIFQKIWQIGAKRKNAGQKEREEGGFLSQKTLICAVFQVFDIFFQTVIALLHVLSVLFPHIAVVPAFVIDAGVLHLGFLVPLDKAVLCSVL